MRRLCGSALGASSSVRLYLHRSLLARRIWLPSLLLADRATLELDAARPIDTPRELRNRQRVFLSGCRSSQSGPTCALQDLYNSLGGRSPRFIWGRLRFVDTLTEAQDGEPVMAAP